MAGDKYGQTNRMLGQLKALVDTMMDVRNDEEDLTHLKTEMQDLLERTDGFKNWPAPFKDLANSIVEIVMDEVD
jgi:hypothetical protein